MTQNILVFLIGRKLAEERGEDAQEGKRVGLPATPLSSTLGLILALVRTHLGDPNATVVVSEVPGKPKLRQVIITTDSADRLQAIKNIQACFRELAITGKELPSKP
jgi:hypothetical protein